MDPADKVYVQIGFGRRARNMTLRGFFFYRRLKRRYAERA